jgi:hypothetical protein
MFLQVLLAFIGVALLCSAAWLLVMDRHRPGSQPTPLPSPARSFDQDVGTFDQGGETFD